MHRHMDKGGLREEEVVGVGEGVIGEVALGDDQGLPDINSVSIWLERVECKCFLKS